jgi:uncharacterized protein
LFFHHSIVAVKFATYLLAALNDGGAERRNIATSRASVSRMHLGLYKRMTRRRKLLLFELTLFALFPTAGKACLVCCGRHAAASILRLPPPFSSSSSTILFETNAAALTGQRQQQQQQLCHIPREVVSETRRDDTTIVTSLASLSSYAQNTDWKHLFAGNDSFLLNNLGENDKEENNQSNQKNEGRDATVEESDNSTGKNGEKSKDTIQEKVAEEVSMTAAMVASIGFYKRFISPLLPPACRFFPTCSQYGVQAIQEFGPCQGGILTAWRLLRCSPFGGKGYDPPKWPPVFYTYSSY